MSNIDVPAIINLNVHAVNAALPYQPIASAIASNISVDASVRVSYVAAKRDGYIIAESPGANAHRRSVPKEQIDGSLFDDLMRDYGMLLVVDPFTAIAWGWMSVEEAPFPAALHTFLTMTHNKLAEERMMENPSDPDAPAFAPKS